MAHVVVLKVVEHQASTSRLVNSWRARDSKIVLSVRGWDVDEGARPKQECVGCDISKTSSSR